MKRGRKIRAINGHPETRTHTKPTEIYYNQKYQNNISFNHKNRDDIMIQRIGNRKIFVSFGSD